MSPLTYSPKFSTSLLSDSSSNTSQDDEFPFPLVESLPPYTTSPLFTTTRPTSSTTSSSNSTQDQTSTMIKKKSSKKFFFNLKRPIFEALWAVQQTTSSQTWGENVHISSTSNLSYRVETPIGTPSTKTLKRAEKDLERRQKENVWFKGLTTGGNGVEVGSKRLVLKSPWA